MDRPEVSGASDFLQTVIDSLDDELVVINPSFHITHANRALLEAKGWDRALVVGRPCYEVSHRRDTPCELPGDECPARQVWRSGKPCRAIHTHWDSAGGASHVEIVASPIKDAQGAVVSVVEVMRNITERKRLEQSLLQRNHELEAILKGIGDGISIQDREMRIVHVNDVQRHVFGDDIVGKTCHKVYEQREVICPNCPVRAVFDTGKPARSVQQGVTRDGIRRYYDIIAGPIYDESGGVTQVLEVVRDVTREMELARMKDEFISVASHEFRTPLAIIRGYAEMILNRERLAIDVAQEERLLRDILEEVDGLTLLVEDTLNVSRLDSGGMRANLQPVSLAMLVESTVESMIAEANERGIRVSVDIPRNLVVYADGAYVERILLNLLSNALNYSEDRTRVTVWARAVKQMVEVTVKDEGVGIAPEHVRELFGKFTRLPNARSAKVRGTGLGLYITKGLVKAQGGKIWAESKLGTGSTFTFTLPLAAL